MVNQATKDTLSKTLEIPELVDNRIEETLLNIKRDGLKVNNIKDKSYKRPLYKKPVALVAAVIMMFLMFTTVALAYSESFREFVFGDLRVTIYAPEEIDGMYFIETDDGFIVSTNPDDHSRVDIDSFIENFSSIEELQQSTSVTVREPSHLPDNLAFREVGILLNEDGTFTTTVIITYECNINYNMLILSQMYLGADTTLDIEVVDRIEHNDFSSVTNFEAVMIGDIEALLSVTTIEGESVDETISLSWSYDGFAYTINAIGFDVDTLIAIAKSI